MTLHVEVVDLRGQEGARPVLGGRHVDEVLVDLLELAAEDVGGIAVLQVIVQLLELLVLYILSLLLS